MLGGERFVGVVWEGGVLGDRAVWGDGDILEEEEESRWWRTERCYISRSRHQTIRAVGSVLSQPRICAIAGWDEMRRTDGHIKCVNLSYYGYTVFLERLRDRMLPWIYMVWYSKLYLQTLEISRRIFI